MNNISYKFVQSYGSEIPFQYAEISAVCIAVCISLFCCLCYYRFSLAKFPSCSVEFVAIYILLSGRYKDLTVTSGVLVALFAVAKYFQREGLCLIWCFKPLFFIFDEKYVKILSNEQSAVDKPIFYTILSDMIGENLLTHNGSAWVKSRKTLQPAFRFKELRESSGIVNDGAKDIVRNIAKQCSSCKSSLDVLPVLQLGILKIFCEAMLGIKMTGKESEDNLQEYLKLFSTLSESIVNRIVYPWLWWKPTLMFFEEGRKFKKQNRELHDFVRKMAEKTLTSSYTDTTRSHDMKNENKPLQNIFVEKHINDPDLAMKDMENAINVLIAAAFDTTSHSLLWCLFLLGLHPEIQEKAFQEVELGTRNSDGDITYGDISQLDYLDSVIKETLRLYPVVPMFARETRKEVTCGKYIFPKDSIVIFYSYLLHRNPDIYPDPEKFDPERFYRKSFKHPWAYVPFAEGIRNCIGKNFALMEMKIILAHILRNFKVTSLDKQEDILLEWKVVLVPMTPIRFQFTSR